MIGRWSTWKPFPDAYHGEHIEAPIGPGVYEVCVAATGEQIAFGYAKNVAQALSGVVGQGRGWPFFRKAARTRHQPSELEYRTCAAGSVSDAKVAVGQMQAQRQAMMRRFSPQGR